ncbi:MAG: hypothetical protein N2C14_23425, partial [Planctomycetales bacterium]
MPDPSMIERQRVTLRELAELTAERARQEQEIDAVHRADTKKVESDFEQTYEAAAQRFEDEKRAADAAGRQARDTSEKRFQTDQARVERTFQEKKQALVDRFADDEHQINGESREARWTLTTVYDAEKHLPQQQLDA